MRAAGRRLRSTTLFWPSLILLAFLALTVTRPLYPVDETRYASVAWDMWLRNGWWLPTLNGEPYAHKPPLLFWLIHIGWTLFGVHDAWLRVLPALCALGALALTARLGAELWPARARLPATAATVQVTTAPFLLLSTALMFDLLLSLFVTLAWLGMARAWRRRRRWPGFALLAIGVGGGLLTKGPVTLLHVLPAALAAPWWMGGKRPVPWRPWITGVALATLGGGLIALTWAVPAGLLGGAEYRQAIFVEQTTGRMVKSFAHSQPFWFYAVTWPVLLLPWLGWPAWWRGLRRDTWREPAVRFAIAGALGAVLALSMVSGKQLHYLMPETTLLALLVARGLDAHPMPARTRLPALALALLGVAVAAAALWVAQHGEAMVDKDLAVALWAGSGTILVAALALHGRRPTQPYRAARSIALATLIVVATLGLAVDAALRAPYDTQVVAQHLAAVERQGRPIAFAGRYHGQWTYAGRLRRALAPLEPGDTATWLATHPEGRVVMELASPSRVPAGTSVEVLHRYRAHWVAVLTAAPKVVAP